MRVRTVYLMRAELTARCRYSYIFVYNVEITTLQNGEVLHNTDATDGQVSLSIFHESKKFGRKHANSRSPSGRARRKERLSERQYPAHGSGFKH